MGTDISDVPAAYEDWLERLRATYQSVVFCCRYQIGDERAAQAVGARVVAGLVGKPGVFKYSGLPFSGRIARHTERGIADARAGVLLFGAGWDAFVERLRQVSPAHQEFMVLGWVDGRDDEAFAELLGCDAAAAANRRSASLAFWQKISAEALN